jgi:hypothetical protein
MPSRLWRSVDCGGVPRSWYGLMCTLGQSMHRLPDTDQQSKGWLGRQAAARHMTVSL